MPRLRLDPTSPSGVSAVPAPQVVQQVQSNGYVSKVQYLDEIEDVNLSTSPTDDQALVYDSATSKWIPQTVASGGGTWGTITGDLADQTDLATILDSLIESGEAVFFLEDEADPSIAGYKVMDNPAQLEVEAFVTQSTIADGQIVQSWVTDVGLPGMTFIPEGAWLFHVNAYKTGGTKEVRLYNEIYKRNLAGTETLLGTTANSIPLTGVEAILPAFNIYISGTTLLDTDRIVTKTRMRLVGGGSNPTSVTIGYSGDTAARLSIPVQAVDITQFVRTTGNQTISGTKTFSDDIEITNSVKGIILKSPDASRWRITVDNAGILTTTEII